MNIDKLKNKKRHIPKTLMCLSGLLALLIGAKVSAFVINSNQIPEKITLALNSPGRSEENIKKYQLKYTEATDALKKKNLFMPPVAKKKNPVTRVTAVLGDEVCISNKWYKVGDKISDAEITGIMPNEVTIVWNEKESKLKPFDTVVLSAPPKQTTNKDHNKNKSDKKIKKELKKEPPANMEQRRPMGRPKFSDEERQKRMQEYMNKLSPEDRARMQERMRSRGGSRGGGDGGGRGGRGGRGSRGSR